MIKRNFDIVAAGAGLMALSPVFLWISGCIKNEDGGPVFFRGERVGLYGKPFRILKFRTMVVNAEKLGASSTSDDDPRITRIGKFLRKYELDEMPQLINVVKGDTSFVERRAAEATKPRNADNCFVVAMIGKRREIVVTEKSE